MADNFSDTELLEGLAFNLNGTFKRLVDTYDPQLRGYVINHTQCKENTKDIMQNCWVSVFQALNQYPKEKILDLKLRSWLFTIVDSKMLTYLKKRNKIMTSTTSIESFKDDSWEPACEPQLEDIIEMKHQMTLVRIAIEKLPPTSKIVLKLFLLEEFTYEEIAQQLKQPIGTVRTAVSRGLKSLRKMLAANIY